MSSLNALKLPWPAWSNDHHSKLLCQLAYSSHMIELMLDSQRLLYTPSGTQLWVLNAQANRWQPAKREVFANLNSENAVMNAVELADKVSDYAATQYHSFVPLSQAVGSLLLNRRYYLSCWGCGQLNHRSQIQENHCAKCRSHLERNLNNCYTALGQCLKTTAELRRRKEIISPLLAGINALHRIKYDWYGPHSYHDSWHVVTEFPKSQPQLSNEQVMAMKHNLLMNRRFFPICEYCGDWGYLEGECSDCKFRVFGIVH